LTDVPANAVFTDTFPSSQSVSYITGLQSQLDGKVANSRVLTDVPSGAIFTDTVHTSRPISFITGLQGELNNKAGQSATTVALSNKVDKEGSISASESSANLLARVQTAVPNGALFTDTVFNAATDVPNGSLDINQVGGLTAVLNTFKNATDSDTADTTLQNNIDTLETYSGGHPSESDASEWLFLGPGAVLHC